jgi:hypothetical protein
VDVFGGFALIRFVDLRQKLLSDRPAGAFPLGWVCFQLGLLLLASSALSYNLSRREKDV